jgi:hypothetical protein
MSHNIARIEGTDQAWYQGHPAWHKLGTVTPGAKTAKAVIRAVPVFRKRIEVAPVYMKVGGRMDRDRGPRGDLSAGLDGRAGDRLDDYERIQDTDGLLTMEAIVNAARRASFVTAGLLGKGERAFASIDLSRVIDLRIKRDPSRHESHLFGTWAHDGSSALQLRPVEQPRRVPEHAQHGDRGAPRRRGCSSASVTPATSPPRSTRRARPSASPRSSPSATSR